LPTCRDWVQTLNKSKLMFKHYFEQMEGVSIYPVFSLLIFFLFFVGLGIYVFFLDKKTEKHMENLPLED